MQKWTKSGLAVALSRLSGFRNPQSEKEQYLTDSEIAAEVLWNAYLRQKVSDRTVADLGSGTGILGLGALILGATRVYLVDCDARALEIAKKNLKFLKSEYSIQGEVIFLHADMSAFDEKVDLVVQNPPFGAKRESKRHIDLTFLDKALEISPNVYSFHKSETLPYIITSYLKKKGISVDYTMDFLFPIKASYGFHKKRILRVKVSCIAIERKGI